MTTGPIAAKAGDRGGRPYPLHTKKLMARAGANRAFALVYSCAVLALLYHHLSGLLLHHHHLRSSVVLLLADSVLAFMWVATQAFRMFPTHRREFVENLAHYAKESDYPGVDVFICTADPCKEPPMSAVNTALSVMAYDYPTEKLSVYVSDDGGSKLTLFAFMEAARFAAHWLPYCRKNNVVERCPKAHFESSGTPWFPETGQLKAMYEGMQNRVENVVRIGDISPDYINEEEEAEILSKWTDGFTPQNHPPVIQVVLEHGKDKDASGHAFPNLVYVSRGKGLDSPHHFKAGALNALLRVSATMTNAPVVLTLDSDMYSNDPQTPLRALCYLLDPSMDPKQGYVQFPQVFCGINKNDIYGGELRHLLQAHLPGMDGLAGPLFIGSGCFFRRRVFFGSPSDQTFEMLMGRMDHINRSIKSREVLAMAHHVTGYKYENQTKWGKKIGFRYGALVEDLYTSCQLQGEGWNSVYCNPKRPAFLGKSPINLHDFLNQSMRWSVGLLEVIFSKYSPITYGVRSIGLLSGLCFTSFTLWGIWAIPLTVYAFLPQLALLHSTSIFPKASSPWFWVYVGLFFGAYGQECLEYVLSGGTTIRWWNYQRAWMMRGLSSFSFGLVEFALKFVGISSFGFNVTSKVVEEEQSKRYHQGVFEFGVRSPIFLPITTAAIINLIAFLSGVAQVCRGIEWWVLLGLLTPKAESMDDVFLQMLLAGFGVVNCWPLYEGMVLRTDKGKVPVEITLISIVLALALYLLSFMAL